jgi:hypothetical protein
MEYFGVEMSTFRQIVLISFRISNGVLIVICVISCNREMSANSILLVEKVRGIIHTRLRYP